MLISTYLHSARTPLNAKWPSTKTQRALLLIAAHILTGWLQRIRYIAVSSLSNQPDSASVNALRQQLEAAGL